MAKIDIIPQGVDPTKKPTSARGHHGSFLGDNWWLIVLIVLFVGLAWWYFGRKGRAQAPQITPLATSEVAYVIESTHTATPTDEPTATAYPTYTPYPTYTALPATDTPTATLTAIPTPTRATARVAPTDTPTSIPPTPEFDVLVVEQTEQPNGTNYMSTVHGCLVNSEWQAMPGYTFRLNYPTGAMLYPRPDKTGEMFDRKDGCFEFGVGAGEYWLEVIGIPAAQGANIVLADDGIGRDINVVFQYHPWSGRPIPTQTPTPTETPTPEGPTETPTPVVIYWTATPSPTPIMIAVTATPVEEE